MPQGRSSTNTHRKVEVVMPTRPTTSTPPITTPAPAKAKGRPPKAKGTPVSSVIARTSHSFPRPTNARPGPSSERQSTPVRTLASLIAAVPQRLEDFKATWQDVETDWEVFQTMNPSASPSQVRAFQESLFDKIQRTEGLSTFLQSHVMPLISTASSSAVVPASSHTFTLDNLQSNLSLLSSTLSIAKSQHQAYQAGFEAAITSEAFETAVERVVKRKLEALGLDTGLSDVELDEEEKKRVRYKRPRKAAVPRDVLLEEVIHYSFHFLVQKEYKKGDASAKAKAKKYSVRSGPGVAAGFWPEHIEGGQEVVASYVDEAGEQQDRVAMRPNWDDVEHPDSQAFQSAVIDIASREVPAGTYSHATIKDAFQRYWDNTYTAIKKARDVTATEAKNLKAAIKRREGRRNTQIKARNQYFNESPLAHLPRAKDYELLLQEDTLGDYLSDDEDGRYEVVEAGEGEVFSERDWYMKESLGGMPQKDAKVWEYRGCWWMSKEYRLASIILDAYIMVKEAGKVTRNTLWSGPYEKWRPKNHPSANISAIYPPVRPRGPDGLPKTVARGSIIVPSMCTPDALAENPSFQDRLYPDNSSLPEGQDASAMLFALLEEPGNEKLKQVANQKFKSIPMYMPVQEAIKKWNDTRVLEGLAWELAFENGYPAERGLRDTLEDQALERGIGEAGPSWS